MQRSLKIFIGSAIGLLLLGRLVLHLHCRNRRNLLRKALEGIDYERISDVPAYKKGANKKTTSREWEHAELLSFDGNLVVVRFNVFFDKVKSLKSFVHLTNRKEQAQLKGLPKPVLLDRVHWKDDHLLVLDFKKHQGIEKEAVTLTLDLEGQGEKAGRLRQRLAGLDPAADPADRLKRKGSGPQLVYRRPLNVQRAVRGGR